MKDIPFTIRNFQSRKKVRLPLGEPVQLLKGLCEGIVWTAAPGKNRPALLPLLLNAIAGLVLAHSIFYNHIINIMLSV